MLSHLFLNLLPWVVVAAFSVLLTAESLWRAMGSTEQSNGLTHVVTKVSLSLILVIAALVSLNTSLPNLTVLRKFQLILAMCLLVVVLAHALSQPNSSKSSQLDTALLMLFSALTALFLILSSNLITLFLALELVNMLILYSFLATSHRSIESSQSSGAAVVSACVYQFILNFFSSIVMFVGISGYVSVTGGADISAARIFLDDQSVSGYASMMLLAFLLKFGTGPWIFFKINIYKGMNFGLVLIYSVFYLSIVFPFFLNLVFDFGLTFTLRPYYAVLLGLLLSVIAFSGSAFNTPNVFVFLSFSSLLNFVIFLVQALSVSVVFE